MVMTLHKDWWDTKKDHYVFDPEWFDAFKKIDPRFILPARSAHGVGQLGKMGIVFWHESDGNTILPVGITYRDGNQFTFCYHPDYVDDLFTQEISVTLPKTKKPYVYKDGKALLPYFDNLVSEGWLGMIQRNTWHKFEGKTDVITDRLEFEEKDDGEERYKRLLTFGRGFHGAIAVVDAAASDEILAKEERDVGENVFSRATIGGAQPKTLALKIGNDYITPPRSRISTHIVKLPSEDFPRIVQNEYLNIVATRALLPKDTTVEAEIYEKFMGSLQPALAIKRFDRTEWGGRIPFEEALQIKGEPAHKRAELSYKELGEVTRQMTGEAGVEQLFGRLVAQFVLGNTDSHFKNFAFWKKNGHWELTPGYDLISTANYEKSDSRIRHTYSQLALSINGHNYNLRNMRHIKILLLGRELGIPPDRTKEIACEIKSRIALAKEAVMQDTCPYVTDEEKLEFCKRMEGRANHQLSGFGRYSKPIGEEHGVG
jgi:serine/threonine-protein kinase HipA